LEVLSDAVTAFGYHAFPAANAIQGLREVRERRPHVVLLDLSMPALDGHAGFERLISSLTPCSIVIVVAVRDARAVSRRLTRHVTPRTIGLQFDTAHLKGS